MSHDSGYRDASGRPAMTVKLAFGVVVGAVTVLLATVVGLGPAIAIGLGVGIAARLYMKVRSR
jgi:tetrahydromethanopterin S-methyltransferase subunit E